MSKNPATIDFTGLFGFSLIILYGEALALCYKDVQDGLVSVVKSVKHLSVDGAYQSVVSTPKTRSSIRKVPIASNVKSLLDKHIELERQAARSRGQTFNEDSLVFPSETGKYRDHKNALMSFDRLLKRLGIPKDGRYIHTLRDTFATMNARNGTPMSVTKELLGHASIVMTADIYTHLESEDRRQAVDSVSEKFNFD